MGKCKIITNGEMFRIVPSGWSGYSGVDGAMYYNTDRDGYPMYIEFKTYNKAIKWITMRYPEWDVCERKWRDA